jgi:hypothetical protein
MTDHPISKFTKGETCHYRDGAGLDACGRAASHKIEEVIFDDDPFKARHPATNYLCCGHFARVMGGHLEPCNDDEIRDRDYARIASVAGRRLRVSEKENTEMEALMRNLVASTGQGIEGLMRQVHSIELFLRDKFDLERSA